MSVNHKEYLIKNILFAMDTTATSKPLLAKSWTFQFFSRNIFVRKKVLKFTKCIKCINTFKISRFFCEENSFSSDY